MNNIYVNQYQMFADQICEYTLLQNGCNLKVVFFSLKFAPLARQVQNTGHRSQVTGHCFTNTESIPNLAFKGVWDTFCVSKTMTCDLCFVSAASCLIQGEVSF